uniref:Uncharacterized protein n=1 Tax=Fagus sylvatica TaxID=28930 RepID=A0A2N9IZ72_FAGSY
MSQKVGRHQRKPSQTVFMSFDDISAPPSDNAADKVAVPLPPPNQPQPQPPQQIRAPLPSNTPAPAPASTESLPKHDTKPTDLGN